MAFGGWLLELRKCLMRKKKLRLERIVRVEWLWITPLVHLTRFLFSLYKRDKSRKLGINLLLMFGGIS